MGLCISELKDSNGVLVPNVVNTMLPTIVFPKANRQTRCVMSPSEVLLRYELARLLAS